MEGSFRIFYLFSKQFIILRCTLQGHLCKHKASNKWHWHSKDANKNVNPGFGNVYCETSAFEYIGLIDKPS